MSEPRATSSPELLQVKFIKCYLRENISFTIKMTLETGTSLGLLEFISVGHTESLKALCHPSSGRCRQTRHCEDNNPFHYHARIQKVLSEGPNSNGVFLSSFVYEGRGSQIPLKQAIIDPQAKPMMAKH